MLLIAESARSYVDPAKQAAALFEVHHEQAASSKTARTRKSTRRAAAQSPSDVAENDPTAGADSGSVVALPAGTGAPQRCVPVVTAHVGARPHVRIDVAGLAVHSMLSKIVDSVARPFADAHARYEQSNNIVLPIIDELISDVQWAQDFRFQGFKGDDEHHWTEPADMPLRRGESHGSRRARHEALTRRLRACRDDHRQFQASAWYVQHCG